MNTATSNAKKVRFGTFKIRIGSNHVIKGPDGIKRQFTTLDISRHPEVKTIAVCLKCGEKYETEEALLAAHPENRVLAKNEESHPYGWWSDDVKEGGKKKDVIGLLSDEE